jgi:outer membrane protein assembly factor BamB
MRKSTWTVALAVSGFAAIAFQVFAQDWPQWRGPNRDNKVVGFAAPKTWPKDLNEKWSVNVGDGVSSPVLAAGKIYIFSRIGDDEVTLCLDADTGKELWRDGRPTAKIGTPAKGFKNEFFGTRSTPAVAEGKVVTYGSSGAVTCLDTDGKFVWRKETKGKPQFYTSTSPLIVDGKAIVYTDALTAFNLNDGEVQWTWSGSKSPDNIPYGSPVLMTLDGAKLIVTPTKGAIDGVNLADGKILWSYKTGSTAYQSTYGTPVIDGQNVIYSMPGGKGGGGGTVAFKVEKKGDAYEATEVWKVKAAAYQYNTPVLKDGLLFGLSADKKFFCMDAKTGNELWKDATARGETAGILDAGPVILALSETTGLIAFEPSGKGYAEVAHYKVSSTPGFSYPIVVGNRVYVKGEKNLSLWTID